jgi:hypothetical protein
MKSGAHDCLLQKPCTTDVDGYNMSPLIVAVNHNVEVAREHRSDEPGKAPRRHQRRQ